MRYSNNIKNYIEFRNKILLRDNYKCLICNSSKKIEVHHIYPRKTHPHLILSEWNVISLCHSCHIKIRYRELAFLSLFLKLVSKKPLDKIEQTLYNLLLGGKKIKLYGPIKDPKGKTTNKETKKNTPKRPKSKISRAKHKI